MNGHRDERKQQPQMDADSPRYSGPVHRAHAAPDVMEYWRIALFGRPEPTHHRLQPTYPRTSAVGMPLCLRPFVCIRGDHSRSRNVNELINGALDPDALFGLRV